MSTRLSYKPNLVATPSSESHPVSLIPGQSKHRQSQIRFPTSTKQESQPETAQILPLRIDRSRCSTSSLAFPEKISPPPTRSNNNPSRIDSKDRRALPDHRRGSALPRPQASARLSRPNPSKHDSHQHNTGVNPFSSTPLSLPVSSLPSSLGLSPSYRYQKKVTLSRSSGAIHAQQRTAEKSTLNKSLSQSPSLKADSTNYSLRTVKSASTLINKPAAGPSSPSSSESRELSFERNQRLRSIRKPAKSSPSNPRSVLGLSPTTPVRPLPGSKSKVPRPSSLAPRLRGPNLQPKAIKDELATKRSASVYRTWHKFEIPNPRIETSPASSFNEPNTWKNLPNRIRESSPVAQSETLPDRSRSLSRPSVKFGLHPSDQRLLHIASPSEEDSGIERIIDPSSPAQHETVSDEAQYRLALLDRIRNLVGPEHYEATVDVRAVRSLVCQSELYETQEDLRAKLERSQGLTNGSTDGLAELGDRKHFTPPLSLFSDDTSLATPRIDISSELQSTLSPGRTIKKASSGLFGRLGWKLKPSSSKPNKTPNVLPVSSNQESHNAGSSAVSRGRSPNLANQIEVATAKKAAISHSASAPVLRQKEASEQKRRSLILGAPLKSMNRTTCFVVMGNFIHVLPTMVFSAIEEIYSKGMRTPGILRISGDFNRIDSLIRLFENCPTSPVDLSSEGVHTLCGLVKQYLRALPEPIFHKSLTKLFWSFCVSERKSPAGARPKSETDSNRFLVARMIMRILPTRFSSLLIYVVSFLAQIPLFPENRVTKESLAGILGPAIFALREAGIPGLGGYHNQGLSQKEVSPKNTTGNSDGSRQVSSSGTMSAVSEVDKAEESVMATESMMWILKNWGYLIVGLGEDGEGYRAEASSQARQSPEGGNNNPEIKRTSLKSSMPLEARQISTEPEGDMSDSNHLSGQSPSGKDRSYDSTPPLSPNGLSRFDRDRETSADDYSVTQLTSSPGSSIGPSPNTARVKFLNSHHHHPLPLSPSHLDEFESETIELFEPHIPKKSNGIGLTGKNPVSEPEKRASANDSDLLQELMFSFGSDFQMIDSIGVAKQGSKSVLKVLAQCIHEREAKLQEQVEINKRMMEEIERLRMTNELGEREMMKIKDDLLERENRLTQYESDVGKLLLGRMRLLGSRPNSFAATTSMTAVGGRLGGGGGGVGKKGRKPTSTTLTFGVGIIGAEFGIEGGDNEDDEEEKDEDDEDEIENSSDFEEDLSKREDINGILRENYAMKEEVKKLRDLNSDMAGRLEVVKRATSSSGDCL